MAFILVKEDKNDFGGVLVPEPISSKVFIAGRPASTAGTFVTPYTKGEDVSPAIMTPSTLNKKVYFQGKLISVVGDLDNRATVYSSSLTNSKVSISI